MSAALEKIARKSPYPIGDLPAPDSEGEFYSVAIPAMSLKDGNQLCVNAQRFYPGRLFVARVEGDGVRIWRTM